MIDQLNDALHSITTGFFIKYTIASISTLLFFHLHLLAIFAALVVLDTATKWIALAYDYSGRADLITAIKAIPAAHRARVIDSGKMKRGFFSKMVLYMILTIGAFWLDDMIMLTHDVPVFVRLTVSYLCVTEFVSVLENLNDAGVTCLTRLIEMIKRKGGL